MKVQLTPKTYIRGEPVWSAENVNEFLANEMLESNDGGIATRTIKNMNQTTLNATETLENSTDAIVKALNKMENASTNAQNSIKTRVSQLKDYQSQLTTAIANINKTINDKQLEHLVANTERLVSALQALDVLNKQGSLNRIFEALGKK